MRKQLYKKKNSHILTCIASCLFSKHDEMQIDVVISNQAQQETSKEYGRKVILPPYVSWALNLCRILNLSPYSAACFAYVEDTWWYCTAGEKTVFMSLLWVHITDHWKTSCRQFYGSMGRFPANRCKLRFMFPLKSMAVMNRTLKCAHQLSADPWRNLCCF